MLGRFELNNELNNTVTVDINNLHIEEDTICNSIGLDMEVVESIEAFTMQLMSINNISVNYDEDLIDKIVDANNIGPSTWNIFDTMFHLDPIAVYEENPKLHHGLKLYAYYSAYKRRKNYLTLKEKEVLLKMIHMYVYDFSTEKLNALFD